MCEFSDASFGEVADVGGEVADSVSEIGEGLDSIEELSEFTDSGSDTFESINEADDLTGLDDAAIDECALDAEAVGADFSELVDIDEGIANGRFQRPAGSQYPASQGHNWRPTGRLKT